MKSRFCETVARRAPLPKLLGQIGRGLQLLAGQAAAQHRRADIAQPGWRLRMNADVIAKTSHRALSRNAGSSLKSSRD